MIKKYLSLALGFLATVGTLLAKIFYDKAKRERKAKEKFQRQVEHAKHVDEQDNAIESEFRSRRADALNEIKDSNYSTELSSPNDGWLPDNEDDTK
jgi:hypothetical protein